MSEGKKPSLLDRLLGGGQPKTDEPAEPVKKAPDAAPAKEAKAKEPKVKDAKAKEA